MRPNALWHACKAAVCRRRGHPLPFITGSLVSLCCMFSAGFTPNAAQVSPSSRLSLHNCHFTTVTLFFLFSHTAFIICVTMENINIYSHAQSQTAGSLWFPSASSRSQGESGGRDVVRRNTKRREEKDSERKLGPPNPA